jgi:hypothetical protein
VNTDRPSDHPNPRPRWTSPLLEESLRNGTDPHRSVRIQMILGWIIFGVPLRLMPYRGAARMMVGTTYAASRELTPDDVDVLRLRTLAGEPCWIFAVRADLMPGVAAVIRRRRARRTP